MKEFGWTIEYTLSLTFPVFFDLFGLIRRVRLDAAVEEFYIPYGAVKFGGKCARHLFEGKGSVILSDSSEKPEQQMVTDDMVRKAQRKLRALMKSRRNALQKAATF